MERLTEKVFGFVQLKACGNDFCKETCAEHDEEKSCKNCPIQKAFDKLAEYENLEEQGLLLRLPCKVGDTVYVIAPNYEKCKHKTECEDYDSEEFLVSWCKLYCRNGYKGMGAIPTIVKCVEVRETGIYIFTEYGYRNVENFFLTQEQAEQRLKEMGDGANENYKGN